MKRDKSTLEGIYDALDSAIRVLYGERCEGLKALAELQAIKDEVLEKEYQRLLRKYGAENPRVKKIMDRIEYNERLLKDLEIEIERAKITVPELVENIWLIRGRVLDNDGKAAAGLTVTLYDKDLITNNELGSAETDKHGNFTIPCNCRQH
jgi:hypothetical protein